MEREGKTRKRELLITTLLSENTIEKAARKAGISKSTALRWMQEPTFRELYASTKRDILKMASAILTRASSKAALTLVEISQTKRPKAHQASRVASAKAILRIAHEAFELESFDERLRLLEESTRVQNQ